MANRQKRDDRDKNDKTATNVTLSIGDYVLLGGTRASYPCHWYLGSVLWVGKSDMLVQRSTQNGETWREVVTISEVRARGTIADLVRIQETARKSVQDFQSDVIEAESALGRARAALFARLDELAGGGLEIIPPDFEQIDADHAAIRGAVAQYDEDECAAIARATT